MISNLYIMGTLKRWEMMSPARPYSRPKLMFPAAITPWSSSAFLLLLRNFTTCRGTRFLNPTSPYVGVMSTYGLSTVNCAASFVRIGIRIASSSSF